MNWILFLAAFAVAAPPSKLDCAKKELARKDCLLKAAPLEVQVSSKKIIWKDGTWTAIADVPMPEDDFIWERVNFQKFGQRPVLQMWIWDRAAGENKLQSLHWIVGEFKERQFEPLVDQVVRKRRVKATEPVSYSFDPWVKHKLIFEKKGLRWIAGRNSGWLGKDKNGL